MLAILYLEIRNNCDMRASIIALTEHISIGVQKNKRMTCLFIW